MKSPLLLLIFINIIAFTSCSQSNGKKQAANTGAQPIVGGGCEGCEAIYESPVPFEKLKPVDTLPDYYEAGPKIGISGIVYQSDGHTPAKDVIIYIYHTDQNGKYTTRGDETGWGKRHGYIRGWVKTDQNGFYEFFTLVPSPYPNSKNPRHIHPVIKEADKNEYYIDEFLFDNDPFITAGQRNNSRPRGGDGIMETVLKNGTLSATRDIILGLNVPGYPVLKKVGIRSGLAVGDDCPAFDPLHLSGADKGRTVCPMCKYGFGQGAMVWFNHANPDQIKRFALKLENEIANRGETNFRVFLIYMNPLYNGIESEGKLMQDKLKKWCSEQGLQKVAVVWVPSPEDKETCGIYKINPEAKNTTFVYKRRKIFAKWINTDYSDEFFHDIMKKIDSPVN